MLLATKRGFFSVVAHCDNPDIVIVGSRSLIDMMGLHAIGSELVLDLDMPGIVETLDPTPAYQMYIERDVWEVIVVALTVDIDYTELRGFVA